MKSLSPPQRITLRFSIFLALICFGTTCLPRTYAQKASQWHPVVSAEGGFRVSLPGKPANKEEPRSNADARLTTVTLRSEEKSTWAYLVVVQRFNEAARQQLHRRVPPGGNPSAAYAALFRERSIGAIKPPAEVKVDTRPLVLPGLRGEETILSNAASVKPGREGKMYMRIRTLYTKDAVIILCAATMGDNAKLRMSTVRLFDSFVLKPLPVALRTPVGPQRGNTARP